ncbi:hypothetical protein, partial [Mesorhizobium sp. M7A.F.Ca.CA.002.09.1.1]|uniref:hypothetical protein n=1 Tax=Mesorhizobium sp. M7A.F.Ca.CA.002.09.1.1 TaxID=2496739 RepID=UPI0019D1230C
LARVALGREMSPVYQSAFGHANGDRSRIGGQSRRHLRMLHFPGRIWQGTLKCRKQQFIDNHARHQRS